jgi:hypothetical protein
MTSEGGKEVWIGLVTVRPRRSRDLLNGAAIAYVNVLAVADCAKGFERHVFQVMRYLDLSVEAIEDSEPLRVRMKTYAVGKDLLRLAREVSETGLPRCGTFFACDDGE